MSGTAFLPAFAARTHGAEKAAKVDIALKKKMVPRDRIELPTLRFSVACSTN